MRWTREPPTKPGWYWAEDELGEYAVRVHRSYGEPSHLFVYDADNDSYKQLDHYRAWSSTPIPLPEGEVPE